MRIFVSHNNADAEFCRDLVRALRDASTDVWYDEQDLGSGNLLDVIQLEIESRPVYLLILSQLAIASRWVRREAQWAYELTDRDPTRILLPVTFGAVAQNDLNGQNGWLFLSNYKRIEAPGARPYPPEEAIQQTLIALSLVSREDSGPIPAGDEVESLLMRARVLLAQGEANAALPVLQQATRAAQNNFSAWFLLGHTLYQLGRYEESLAVDKQATALDPTVAKAWYNRGLSLQKLAQPEEALEAYRQCVALDSEFFAGWYNQAIVLYGLHRYDEAVVANERALALTPEHINALGNQGLILYALGRYPEALAAYDHALRMDPAHFNNWKLKAAVLEALGHTKEAEEARAMARALSVQS